MLQVNPETGVVADARQVPSPNCDDRPDECRPELIIVHNISLPPGEFGGPWIDRFFSNRLDPDAHPYFREIAGLRVSSHLLVERSGSLVQYVPLTRRAWHAGQSCYADRECCNDFSIGIELEGTDESGYTDDQYDALCEVITAVRDAYPSLADAPIVGHSDVAPDRKTDPGPMFDWDRLGRQLAGQGVPA